MDVLADVVGSGSVYALAGFTDKNWLSFVISNAGADQVLFASDCPFDPEKGPAYIRETIKVLDSLDLSQEDRGKICFRNAEKLCWTDSVLRGGGSPRGERGGRR